jgi:hypothetical protein
VDSVTKKCAHVHEGLTRINAAAPRPVRWTRSWIDDAAARAARRRWNAWVCVGCGLVLALIFSAAYFDQAADHRPVNHGYPPDTAQRIRSDRDKAVHPDRMRRYMQTYRTP